MFWNFIRSNYHYKNWKYLVCIENKNTLYLRVHESCDYLYALTFKYEIHRMKFSLLDCSCFWLSYDSISRGQIRSFFVTVIHIQYTHAYASAPEHFAYIKSIQNDKAWSFVCHMLWMQLNLGYVCTSHTMMLWQSLSTNGQLHFPLIMLETMCYHRKAILCGLVLHYALWFIFEKLNDFIISQFICYILLC